MYVLGTSGSITITCISIHILYLFKLLYAMQLKKHISVSVIINIDGKMNKPLASYNYIYI